MFRASTPVDSFCEVIRIVGMGELKRLERQLVDAGLMPEE
jgi:hypothetical protein